MDARSERVPRGEDALRAALQQSVDVAHWINDNFSHIALPGEGREQMAYACWDAALEHYDSIVRLAYWERYGTILALLRVLFEALIRGCWFAQCATDDQLGQFRYRDALPDGYTFETLIREFERAVGSDIGALLKLKKDWWNQMNSYTHTGMHQMSRRFRDGTIGPNYSADAVVEGLNTASLLALFAATQIAATAKDDGLAVTALAAMEAFQPK